MIQSPIFAKREYGNIAVISTSRFGGVSTGKFKSFNLADHVGDDSQQVASNRQVLAQLLEANSLKVLAANHGADVQFVDESSTITPGDGFVTKSINLGLVALAADCVPFALVDPTAQLVAVGHCGWKGLVAKLPEALAQTFAEHGGQASRSIAVLGPAICAKCYEVETDRVDLVALSCPSAVADKRHLDISAGVIEKLANVGFQIEQIAGCTVQNSELYSYRRDGVTGRHALAVVINQSENEL